MAKAKATGRSTTAQWMRDNGYDVVWKSLNPEERRNFKFARALVERFGKELIPKAEAHERKAKEFRAARTCYDEVIKKLDGLKSVLAGFKNKDRQ